MKKGLVHRRLERLSKGLSRRGLYEFLHGEYARIDPHAVVLAVGSGGPINTRLADAASRRGFSVQSVDIDPARGPDVVGDICSLDLGEERFDAVVMCEVLEHVHSPHLALENVRRALRPGGRLILSVPFIFPIHNRPRDYYRFTRYGLEFLLRDFRDVQVRERNGWAHAVNVLGTRHYKEADRRSRLAAPFFVAAAYAGLPFALVLDRLLPTDFITTGYVATAVR